MSRERLGAWLVRCNPTRTDMAARFAQPVRSWCVSNNYRSQLMQPGDEILLWVSGRDARFTRGVWGRGRVTTSPDWVDGGLQVGLDLSLAEEPLATDAELRAVGVSDLEVQRMPQGSNPSWVTTEQLRQISSLS